ncbi:hypothetical protein M413DRAFT_30072 [Hebeloma cylindrosporum]|uniref:Uncharacterized protein n=1 Tax=Hebeloma cylindrosporum TaxID=76867 RepID=A0A0C3BPC1_HEBCY|nr:hypothetical protein M413DRAFT_30072 [Hebeloma cylindrosporum h7]
MPFIRPPHHSSPVGGYISSSPFTLMTDRDFSQVKYVGDRIRYSDMPGEYEGAVPSAYRVDNDFFTGLGGYVGQVHGRQVIATTIIYATTFTDGGALSTTDDPFLPVAPALPSPSPPPSSSPSPSNLHSLQPSPPPSSSLPLSTSSPHPLPSSSSMSHSHLSWSSSSSSSLASSSASTTSPSPSFLLSLSLSPSPSPSSPQSPTHRNSSNLAPIVVGGIAGAILFLILFLLTLFFYCRRRRRSRNMIDPFTCHLNRCPNGYIVMHAPPRAAKGSSCSHFRPSPDPLFALPCRDRVELPPAYTQA